MKIIITPLDKLFSQYIRMLTYNKDEGTAHCEYCGKVFWDMIKENGEVYPAWKHLQCSHFFSRRSKATRWDLDNAAGLCFSCHMYLGGNPYVHTEWFKKRLGSEKFEQLVIRVNMIVKRSKADKEQLYRELKEQVKLMEAR